MDKGCLITTGFMAALCAAIVGLIIYAVRPNDDEPGSGALSRSGERKVTIARIPWNEVDKIYQLNPAASDRDPNTPWPELEGQVATDLKKEALWANYKGRTVEWEGQLVDVKAGPGGHSLGIKMNESSPTKDIILALKKTESRKAKKLIRGDRVKFRGRLRSWGSLVRFAMDQGEILD